jgi:hypothetical protein
MADMTFDVVMAVKVQILVVWIVAPWDVEWL